KATVTCRGSKQRSGSSRPPAEGVSPRLGADAIRHGRGGGFTPKESPLDPRKKGSRLPWSGGGCCRRRTSRACCSVVRAHGGLERGRRRRCGADGARDREPVSHRVRAQRGR